jgi:hypothetical protein
VDVRITLPLTTLGDVMNANNDPRRAAFFKNLDSVGNVTAAPHGLQSDYYQFSQPGSALEDPTWSHAAINYVEVEFLMAHAAVAGWAGAGDAATHYNAGITASMEEWLGCWCRCLRLPCSSGCCIRRINCSCSNWYREMDCYVQQRK